jgi:protease secretion system membrane fusion protein
VARANFESARQRYVGLRAMEGRLQAEQLGLSKVKFHPDVVQASEDPQIRQMVLTQEQLFSSRRAALQAELQSTEESIQGQKGLIQSYEGMLINRQNQCPAPTARCARRARCGWKILARLWAR